MVIGGLQKLTLLDYPEHVAAIVFTQGCNFRCHYCYNPKLVVPENFRTQKNSAAQISPEDFFVFLDSRRGKLDAVVITGGEPTLHHDLPVFIKKIKDRGFLVKLDTNGTNPCLLQKLFKDKLLDYVAMDIKAPLRRYQEVVGVSVPLENLQKSIILIKNSGLDYEFRSTIWPGLHTAEALRSMGEAIKGAKKWYLQKFTAASDLVDSGFKNQKTYTDAEMNALRETALQYAEFCAVR